MHALNHALYSPMSGVNGALVCVRLPAWRGSVRACTCMRGVRSREAACPQHAHKKKHTDKDVCGPEVARTRIRYANQLQIQIREANAFGAVLEDGRVIDGL